MASQEYRIAIETFGLTARQLDDLVIASVGAIFADGKTRGRVMEACTQGLAEIFPVSMVVVVVVGVGVWLCGSASVCVCGRVHRVVSARECKFV